MTDSTSPRYKLVLTEDQMTALKCVWPVPTRFTSFDRAFFGKEIDEIGDMIKNGDYITIDEE